MSRGEKPAAVEAPAADVDAVLIVENPRAGKTLIPLADGTLSLNPGRNEVRESVWDSVKDHRLVKELGCFVSRAA